MLWLPLVEATEERLARCECCFQQKFIVEGGVVLPTETQAVVSVFVCQMLSNAFQPINIFRYDKKLKTLYIQAGIDDNLAIVIDQNGEWEFV